MFTQGQWVIDTKNKCAVTIVKVLGDGLYIVENDEDEFYIQYEDYIIEYDKYYFD